MGRWLMLTGVVSMAQPDNTLSPIGMAIGILGKYFRYGTLVQSDSLQMVRSWVRPSPATLPEQSWRPPGAADKQRATSSPCLLLLCLLSAALHGVASLLVRSPAGAVQMRLWLKKLKFLLAPACHPTLPGAHAFI